MKNNKGYTLVELLVTLAVFAIIMAEIGNLIMNSSKLYRNGTYEVELQTEAQQIVQQMEELLIDVNQSVSVNYEPSLSADVITISNNDVTYYFVLDMDHPELGYGTLYYNRANVDGSSYALHVPMAEYVQSISLNMENYTSDVVTLNVSMNNGRYGYQASQDIYLRNRVGSGGGGGYNNSSEYDTELVVLRYKTYDLDDVVAGLGARPGETFTYAWDTSDASKLAKATTEYVLSGDTLKLSPAMNNKPNWDKEPGPYKLIATGNMGSSFKIRIRTDKVGYGNDDHAVYYQNVASTFLTMTPVPVYGINVSAADHIVVQLVYDNGTNDVYTEVFRDGTQIQANPQATYYFVSEGPGARVEMSFQGVNFNRNENDNTIEVISEYMQDNQIINHNANGLPGYYEYIRVSEETVRFRVTLSYGSDNEVINIHMLPAPVSNSYGGGYPSLNADSVPPEVSEKFWNAVGF